MPKVAVIRSSGLADASGGAKQSRFGALIDTGMRYLGLSWRDVVSPQDTVGIKVNCLGGMTISTRPELAYAVAERVCAAGVAPDRVIVFDREDRELIAAGYEPCRDVGRVQCYGTDTSPGGYEERLTESFSVGVRLSTIVTEQCTALISVPVVKDHMIAGMTGALKNHFGCIASPNKFHADSCDPYVADFNAAPAIKRRHRLAICDASDILYEGGPQDSPAHHYSYDGIVMGVDMVATDTVIWAIVDGVRREKGLAALADEGRTPTYLATAADRKLGVCRWDSIRIGEFTL